MNNNNDNLSPPPATTDNHSVGDTTPSPTNTIVNHATTQSSTDTSVVFTTDMVEENGAKLTIDIMNSFMRALSGKTVNGINIGSGVIPMSMTEAKVKRGYEEKVANILSPFISSSDYTKEWCFIVSFKKGFNYTWVMMKHPSDDNDFGSVTYYPGERGAFNYGWKDFHAKRCTELILRLTKSTIPIERYKLIPTKGVDLDTRSLVARGPGIINVIVNTFMPKLSDVHLIKKLRGIIDEDLDPSMQAVSLGSVLIGERALLEIDGDTQVAVPTTRAEWGVYNIGDDSSSEEETFSDQINRKYFNSKEAEDDSDSHSTDDGDKEEQDGDKEEQVLVDTEEKDETEIVENQDKESEVVSHVFYIY